MGPLPSIVRRLCVAGIVSSVSFLAVAHGAVSAVPLPSTKIVLKSALSVDPVTDKVVLPLHRGKTGGKTVWYIITDSSDKAEAAQLKVVYSPILAGVGVTQKVTQNSVGVVFAGAPDFTPTREFAPGPTGFPPAKASPGATATAAYSPFIHVNGSETVLNAPIVATGDGPFDVTTHSNTADRVLAIDTAAKTVTLLLVHGFVGGHEVLYLSTEASDPGAATIERAIYVPSLGKAGGKIPILVFANGQTGADNPQAQGLSYAALDGHLDQNATAANSASLRTPLNVLASFPTGSTAAAYSPLWDANVAVWSSDAVTAKTNTRQTSASAVYQLATNKMITGPDGKPFGPVGFVVNCPVVAYIDAAP